MLACLVLLEKTSIVTMMDNNELMQILLSFANS